MAFRPESALNPKTLRREAIQLAPVPSELASQVREAVEAFTPVARSRHVVIQTALEPEIVSVVDPGALRQAGLSRANRGGLKPGDMVKIEGIAAKDGTTTGFLNKLYFPDGRVFVLANKDPYAR